MQGIEYLKNKLVADALEKILEVYFTFWARESFVKRSEKIQRLFEEVQNELDKNNRKIYIIECLKSKFEPLRIWASKLLLTFSEELWDIDDVRHLKDVLDKYTLLLEQGEAQMVSI